MTAYAPQAPHGHAPGPVAVQQGPGTVPSSYPPSNYMTPSPSPGPPSKTNNNMYNNSNGPTTNNNNGGNKGSSMVHSMHNPIGASNTSNRNDMNAMDKLNNSNQVQVTSNQMPPQLQMAGPAPPHPSSQNRNVNGVNVAGGTAAPPTMRPMIGPNVNVNVNVSNPSVKPLPAPIPPPNIKTQYNTPSHLPPTVNQIMHKPNITNIPLPNLNGNNHTNNNVNNISTKPIPNRPPPTSSNNSKTFSTNGAIPPPTATTATTKKTKKTKAKQNTNSSHVNNSLSSNNQGSNVGAHGENTGRWTAEEHRLFLEGLEKHGKGWKKIASLIKSRTVVQIRTHAQKYFQKLAKARHNGDDGDVSMEGRTVGMSGISAGGMHCGGGAGSNTSGNGNGGMAIPPMGDHMKKRRNSAGNVNGTCDPTMGTKRKCIESVVTSVHNEAKRMKEVNDPQVMPSVSPCLAPFVNYPPHPPPVNHGGHGIPPNTHPHAAPHAGPPNAPAPSNGCSIVLPHPGQSHQMAPNTTNEIITPSGPILEDSLYRFLTPMPPDYGIQAPSTSPPIGHPNAPQGPGPAPNNGMKIKHNDPQNGNHNRFIVLPNNNTNSSDPSQFTGEGQSPTCVADIPNFPTFPSSKVAPPSVPIVQSTNMNSNSGMVTHGHGHIQQQHNEPPQWYARGADVDELLHDADALNWLADSGGDLEDVVYKHHNGNNLNNTNLNLDHCTPNPVHYNSNSEVVSLSESEGNGSGVSAGGAPNTNNLPNNHPAVVSRTNTHDIGSTNNDLSGDNQNLATDALPPVISSTSTCEFQGLPNLFSDSIGGAKMRKLSTPNLFNSSNDINMGHPSSGNLVDENFSVFDSAMDEQAFVSALLESNENAALSVSNADL